MLYRGESLYYKGKKVPVPIVWKDKIFAENFKRVTEVQVREKY
jgi:hypothetical protein